MRKPRKNIKRIAELKAENKLLREQNSELLAALSRLPIIIPMPATPPVWPMEHKEWEVTWAPSSVCRN